MLVSDEGSLPANAMPAVNQTANTLTKISAAAFRGDGALAIFEARCFAGAAGGLAGAVTNERGVIP